MLSENFANCFNAGGSLVQRAGSNAHPEEPPSNERAGHKVQPFLAAIQPGGQRLLRQPTADSSAELEQQFGDERHCTIRQIPDVVVRNVSQQRDGNWNIDIGGQRFERAPRRFWEIALEGGDQKVW